MRKAFFALALALAIPGIALAQPKSAQKDYLCLTATDIDHTSVLSDTEILIAMRSGKVWKNTLQHPCPGLKFYSGFSWVIGGDMICSNAQVIRVLQQGNSCFLGNFTSYVPPANSTPH
jgi:hypothetical protein